MAESILHIRLSDDTREKLDKISEADNRTGSQEVRHLIDRAYEEKFILRQGCARDC